MKVLTSPLTVNHEMRVENDRSFTTNKKIIKQKHLSIITLCKIFVPIFSYCVKYLFFYVDFLFRPNN